LAASNGVEKTERRKKFSRVVLALMIGAKEIEQGLGAADRELATCSLSQVM
jgi:hypothetical protein